MKLTVYVFAFDCAWIDTALSGIVNVYGFDVDEATSSLFHLAKLYHDLGVAVTVTSSQQLYVPAHWTEFVLESFSNVTVNDFIVQLNTFSTLLSGIINVMAVAV